MSEPKRFLIAVSEHEAECARRVLAYALKPPVALELRDYVEGAVIHLGRLSTLAEQEVKPNRERDD